jgi:hypothetical protein
MFVMGLLDVAVMVDYCVTAYLSMVGAMYCSSPTFVYIIVALFHGMTFDLLVCLSLKLLL